MTDPKTLTDEELAEAVRAAYEQHMQIECSGAAYSSRASANHAAAARQRYYELATEQDRRKGEACLYEALRDMQTAAAHLENRIPESEIEASFRKQLDAAFERARAALAKVEDNQ